MKYLRSTILSIAGIVILNSCTGNDDGETVMEPVKADFSQSTSKVFTDQSIEFTDKSSGNPNAWYWTFDGGTPSTSTLQNPTVSYKDPGTYDVTLQASRSTTNDEVVKQGVVVVTYDLSRGLIARYFLDGDATDSSGKEHHGEVMGTVNATTNRNNEENKAMDFNEDDGYLTFGNIEALEVDYENTISISVWLNPNGDQLEWDTVLNQYFEGPSPSAPGRFYLGINPENNKLRWKVLENDLESQSALPINEWTHVVVTYSDKTAKMYINGIEDGSLDFGDQVHFFGTGAPFRIGKQSMTGSTTTGFSGKIDDVGIYNRLLDPGEIEILFTQE